MSKPTINELEDFYASVEVGYSIVLPNGDEVFDLKKFSESHLAFLKGNPGNRRFLPYYDRLVQVKQIIE